MIFIRKNGKRKMMQTSEWLFENNTHHDHLNKLKHKIPLPNPTSDPRNSELQTLNESGVEGNVVAGYKTTLKSSPSL